MRLCDVIAVLSFCGVTVLGIQNYTLRQSLNNTPQTYVINWKDIMDFSHYDTADDMNKAIDYANKSIQKLREKKGFLVLDNAAVIAAPSEMTLDFQTVSRMTGIKEKTAPAVSSKGIPFESMVKPEE